MKLTELWTRYATERYTTCVHMHKSSGVIGSAEKYSAAEIWILFGGWRLAPYLFRRISGAVIKFGGGGVRRRLRGVSQIVVSQLPRLKFLHTKHHCIPATSAAIARVFSAAGYIVNAKRSRRPDSPVEQMVNANAKYNADMLP